MVSQVFVYGTLQGGQCRSGMWSAKPHSVEPAWVWGTLFGRDDYPALAVGPDRVLGELWRFHFDDISRVLETLDAIEGTNQPGQPDLYHRVILEAFAPGGGSLADAWAYHYARPPGADGFRRVRPAAENAWVRWP